MTNLGQLLTADKYISHKLSVDAIDESLMILPQSFLGYLRLLLNPRALITVLKLRRLAQSFEPLRKAHNDLFVANELIRRAKFFDNIEGRSLDSQQRRAVVSDEDNSLIIAGAGSGKTLTIVAKVRYLLECLDVDADSILPISFTNKSAADMKERINVNGITPQTFHKFGLTALQTVERRKPNIFDDTNSDKLFRAFIEELSIDQAYLSQLTNFFLNYIKIPKSQFDFETLGDYIQYLKDQNFTTYKKVEIPYQGKTTYRNETVKSVQECIIANYLLFNRIEYEYEAQYEFPLSNAGRKKKYNPDFTLLVNGEKIYLEHFGIDRDNNVPPFFAGPNESYEEAKRKYNAGISWKRSTHASNRTTLLETYSYEFAEDDLLSNLAKRLNDADIKLDPMTPDEIWVVIQESGKDEVDGFVSLCKTFLSLLKSNNYSLKEISDKNDQIEDHFMRERGSQFLSLFTPIYDLYEDNLLNNGQIDFNDMISRATDYLSSGKYHCPLSYVIVDEFQDISIGRYRMLEAIRQQNPDVKFYCVGDDWQSIYRFAGSDIALFRDFEKYFGCTVTSRIETTYRFNEPLISTTSEFILKNPSQTIKQLSAPPGSKPTSHSIVESEGANNDDTEALLQAIQILLKSGMNPTDTIFLIGRYNFDIKRIMNRGKVFTVNYTSGAIKYQVSEGQYKGKTINIQFTTAHKSKGLEAPFTIILNCNSGKYGFPSGKADDPLLNLLLSSADQFENGEERRLFYVAMTRTKRHVVLIADRYRKSKFIKELQDEQGGRALSCPRCVKGELILRSAKPNGRFFRFYGCSNFAYGCSYSQPYVQAEKKQDAGQSAEIVYEPPMVLYPGEEATQEFVDSFFKPEAIAQPPQQPILPALKSKQVISTDLEVEVALPSIRKISSLTASETNRFNAFISKPELYSGTEKARDKVTDLISFSSRFSTEQDTQFENALVCWKTNIKNRPKH